MIYKFQVRVYNGTNIERVTLLATCGREAVNMLNRSGFEVMGYCGVLVNDKNGNPLLDKKGFEVYSTDPYFISKCVDSLEVK